jgi:uncharacterized protein
MRFNVAGLIKAPTGATKEVTLDDPLAVAEAGMSLVEPVRGSLRFVRDHAGILVEGRLSTVVASPCARCLEPARSIVEMDIAEHFRPTVAIPGGTPVLRDPEEEDEPATRIDDKHVLDLTEVVEQTLVTSLPLSPLCRPDCRGLCPMCGEVLEGQACECEPPPDPRWDALRAMVDDVKASATDERHA